MERLRTELREGTRVRIRKEGSPFHLQEGFVYKLFDDGSDPLVLLESGELVDFNIKEIRLPLHDGVFLEGESYEQWSREFGAAKAKLLLALAQGVSDRSAELAQRAGVSIPEEIFEGIKKVIALLGTPEALALIRFFMAL